MQNEVKNTIINNHLLGSGDRCLLAVSGGADSMGLVHVLVRLNNILKVNYRVVHVHHGLRGAEADRDAEFVKDACARLHLPCRIIRVNVNEYVRSHKLSVEEAARLLRYQALEEEARAWELEEDTERTVKIAVAHNIQDNAETIIMQMARGSGLKGLAGMQYVRGRIIRPLLDISRDEIERFLTREGETWIHDSSNDETEYTRNRIRHDILPLIVSEVNAGAIGNITRAAKLVGQADRYLEKQAGRVLNSCIIESGGGYEIPADVLKKQEPIIQSYIIKQLVGKLYRSLKDITAGHIEDVRGLITAETGKRVDLPYRIKAERVYDNIRIFRADAKAAEDNGAPEGFTFRTFTYNGEKAPEDKYTKWFDYDKIDGSLNVRYRKKGDYLELKDVGRKLLTAYMTDAKIPKGKRDEVPVIAAGSNVIWLVGYRIGENFKISTSTKTVMEITFTG